MHSRVRVAGHAVHPALVTFPLGLLSTGVVFDVLFFITGRSSFAVTAAHIIAAGVLGGLVAGLFGFADWTAIPRNTRAKRIGQWHALTNLATLLLFVLSWLPRVGNPSWEPPVWAFVLSLLGLATLAFGGWLGGELVERLGVGVEEDAEVNAPSSLRWASTRARSASPHPPHA